MEGDNWVLRVNSQVQEMAAGDEGGTRGYIQVYVYRQAWGEEVAGRENHQG